MNIIFHEKFHETYDSDPAAAPGRMEPIMRELREYPLYKFIAPVAAEPKDILRAHSARHIERIKEESIIYDMALLAAGGAIKAAELAYGGEPSFACIRPPGPQSSR